MATPTSDKAAIRQTIRALRNAGYTLDSVDDGGEEDVTVTNEREAIEAITAVDAAWLYVTSTGRAYSVFFVMGNSPEEVICDHSVSLEHVIDPLIESWEE